jgi:ABC-type antimicrobial peptide transport system permease subunit
MALSIIGGLLGVAAGVGSAIVLQETLDWSMELSPDVMVIAGIVAAAIGILFGYYPAKTASRLDPMEILRSE